MEQIKVKAKVAEWFETAIRYDKLQDNGTSKTVTEKYVVDAVSFSEAEETIIAEMRLYVSGELKVAAIQRAPYSEVFFSEDAKDDRWYKVKVSLITLDEKSGKEKRTATVYLVQAATLEKARATMAHVMDSGMQDWEIVSVVETMFMDVFEHKDE